MKNFTQNHRLLSISDFGLGKDTFLLTGIEGEEALSTLFSFELSSLSENLEIDPYDIVGKPVTVSIKNQSERRFHGIVSHFTQGEIKGHHMREYKLVMVPWCWLLTKTNNHRIFQEMTSKEIVSQLLYERGFSDFSFLAEGGETREYCVQHNESDWHFISRLLEEEGISYYFRHDEDKHILVFSDQTNSFLTCKETDLEYSKGSSTTAQITDWLREHQLTTGQWTLNDYDFTSPEKQLIAPTSDPSPFNHGQTLEHYEYPDLYQSSTGAAQTKVRIEEEENQKDRIQAKSECASFYAGGRFNVAKHASKKELGEYVITSVHHRAYDISFLQGKEVNSEQHSPGYRNEFSCLRADIAIRPKRRHRRPSMKGSQSAIVVGPKGEEIYTDQYGRIKVQFIWDREGKKNENSSCFLRVMQQWAGNKWGASFTPRIGHEVIVDFLDGDPDRPIVVGSVYNGKNAPPYSSKNQSGIKSRSTKGGTSSNFNEIRFDDTKGAEELFVQAEKAYTLNVKGNSGGTIAGNANNTVAGNADNSVTGNETAAVGGNREASVAGNENHSVAANRSASVGGNETQNVGGALMSTVGGLAKSLVGGPKVENIAGPMNQVVAASSSEQVAAVKSITAGGSIMLQCGAASITLNAGGNIELNGTNITINGTTVGLTGAALVNVKAGGVASIMAGAAVSVAGAGMVSVKGGRIDLN